MQVRSDQAGDAKDETRDEEVIHFTPVIGTFEFPSANPAGAWFTDGPWMAFMKSRGWEPLDPADPFVWSTDVNGNEGWRRCLPALLERLPWVDRRGDRRDWIAGGYALRWRQNHYPYKQRGVFAYSHGGQLVAEACASGLQIPFLVTIATPVRADLAEVWAMARPNIGYWLHLRASRLDVVMLLGTMGDGAFSASQDMPLADENDGVTTMRHGLLLNDPGHFAMWDDEGWLARLESYMETVPQ